MTTSQHDREDADPGLARIRTSLAWTRTALSFAAVGGVALKENIVAGLLILAAALVIWRVGRLDHHAPGRLQAGHRDDRGRRRGRPGRRRDPLKVKHSLDYRHARPYS